MVFDSELISIFKIGLIIVDDFIFFELLTGRVSEEFAVRTLVIKFRIHSRILTLTFCLTEICPDLLLIAKVWNDTRIQTMLSNLRKE